MAKTWGDEARREMREHRRRKADKRRRDRQRRVDKIRHPVRTAWQRAFW